MSYGSTYIQAESAGRVNGRASRNRRDYVKRLVHYEKEFDVNLSRLETRDKSLKDSMVAYTEKMRSIADARSHINDGNSNNDPLFVRAKHIPKYPISKPRKRRPMSLDELIGRDRAKKNDRQSVSKQRPLSDKVVPTRETAESRKVPDELHLPALSDRLKKSSPNVQVSFVSASDLYEIVDFSLKSRGSRQDSINMLNMERKAFPHSGMHSTKKPDPAFDSFIAEAVYDRFERCERKDNSDLVRSFNRPPFSKSDDIRVPTAEELEEDNDSESKSDLATKSFKLPTLRLDPLKYRPNRVKRMKLQNPGLGAIPEDNIISHKVFTQNEPPKSIALKPLSPPPRVVSPHNLASKSNLDAIQEDEGGRVRIKDESQEVVPVLPEPKSTRRILMRDDGDVRIEVTQCPPKPEQSNAKLRAQKKFKKIIFLRDIK